MVPTQEQIDETLKLVVKRLAEIYESDKHFNENVKYWMTKSMLSFHNCTPMQYIYLGLGQIVLNHIDDLKEKQNVSTLR